MISVAKRNWGGGGPHASSLLFSVRLFEAASLPLCAAPLPSPCNNYSATLTLAAGAAGLQLVRSSHLHRSSASAALRVPMCHDRACDRKECLPRACASAHVGHPELPLALMIVRCLCRLRLLYPIVHPPKNCSSDRHLCLAPGL